MFIFIILTEEEQILFQNRDPKILEKIYKEYSRQIFNYLMIKTNGNKLDAEEIFSETFHAVIVSAPKLRDINKVYSWIMSIANRRFIDFLRKKYRDKKYESESEIDENIKADENIAEELIENEKILLLKNAMECLSDEYKKLLTLKYIENKSQKEISELMGRTESSVESLLFRAREALKKELKKTKKAFL
jgi:RNA polymerase sigma factor (sigma-70 family)